MKNPGRVALAAATLGTSELVRAGVNEAMPKVPGAPAYQEDPRQAALRKKMTGDAESFRKNIQGFKDEQFAPELQQANMAEREGLTNVDRSTNRRGLLYSGINDLGRADIGTQKALTVSQAKQDINSLAEQLASQKENAAASVGLEGFQDILNQQGLLNKEAADARAARQAQYQQIGQGLGYGAGAYYAKKNPTETK